VEYLAERERLQRDLAALDAERSDENARLAGVADFLADTGQGWERATQEQRNRLARALFAEIMVRDGAVVAVKPHPELAGFFALDAHLQAPDTAAYGFDRAEVNPVTSASSIRTMRPVDSMSPGAIVFPVYFPLPQPETFIPILTPRSRHATTRLVSKRRPPQQTSKIDPAQWPHIAERARFESLRDLAVAFGVSHETIRKIVRGGGTRDVPSTGAAD
jgi:hypothetical protein